MRFLKIILVVLVALTTFASAWGFEKGDVFTFNKEAVVPITDIKPGIATSKSFYKEYGWIIFIFEKKRDHIYFVTIISSLGRAVDKPFYIKEVRDGEFTTSITGDHKDSYGDRVVFMKI